MQRKAKERKAKDRKSRDGRKVKKPGKGGKLLLGGTKHQDSIHAEPAPTSEKDPNWLPADERSMAIDNLVEELEMTEHQTSNQSDDIDTLIEELDLDENKPSRATASKTTASKTTVYFPATKTRQSISNPPESLLSAVAAVTAAKTNFILPIVGRISLGSSSARRLQTAAVFSFSLYFMVLLFSTCAFWSLLLLIFPLTTLFMVGYLVWIAYDDAPTTGSRAWPLLRGRTTGSVWWSSFCDYFPISLVKTAPLDSNGKYVFGYHPHGIISVGAFGALATNGARVLDLTSAVQPEGTGFDSLFPGIHPRLLTLSINFMLPFAREYLLSLGLLNASKATFRHVLAKGPGSAVVVVVGGAKEATYVEPGEMHLVLEKRRGFVREAMMAGAALVPVIAFGENDVYHKVCML
jgi:2-acylglycerol O-acyltransferase 2